MLLSLEQQGVAGPTGGHMRVGTGEWAGTFPQGKGESHDCSEIMRYRIVL